jgi:hypothetical protein
LKVFERPKIFSLVSCKITLTVSTTFASEKIVLGVYSYFATALARTAFKFSYRVIFFVAHCMLYSMFRAGAGALGRSWSAQKSKGSAVRINAPMLRSPYFLF